MTALSVTREYKSDGSWLADLEADLAAAPGTVIDIQNSGDLLLVIKNGSGGSMTATLAAVADAEGRGGSTVGDVVATIGNGNIAFFEPAKQSMFNTAGVMQVTLSTASSVSVALYRLRKSN